ncbi:MAG: hypothetical protein H0W08_17635, partial [Acidobacteria bacterium]|nr:hypothetical protein [Acidobacteriota bacterium]
MKLKCTAAAYRAALMVVVCLAVGAVGARAQSLSSPWSAADVGKPNLAGSASLSNEVLTIDAAGKDIWGISDEFHFVYQAISGDVDIRARLDSLSAGHGWAKAGVMIRSSLADDASHGYALLSLDNG